MGFRKILLFLLTMIGGFSFAIFLALFTIVVWGFVGPWALLLLLSAIATVAGTMTALEEITD